MTGPAVPETAFTEVTGIIKVQIAVWTARCIWRETPTRDIGIDGQIEHLDADRRATGRIVAVQVKSGKSYFAGETDAYIPFTPTPEHAAYWASFPVPVILVLHDPTREVTYWADARAMLRDGERTIKVLKKQAFDAAGVIHALESDGPVRAPAVQGAELIRRMMNLKSPDHGFDISVFELFFQGLTDSAKSIYFGMDLFHEIADVKAALPGRNGRFTIDRDSFEFIDTYVAFLVAQNLALIDFDQWRRMSRLHQLVGHFISPLTTRGQDLVQLVTALDDALGAEGYRRVAQERFVTMDLGGIDDRTRHILEFMSKFETNAANRQEPA